jgi:serine/tyrosine/threonine adenylyltransferase
VTLSLEHTLAEALPALAEPATPAAWPDPELALLNAPLAEELGLDVDALRADAAAWFGGGQLPEGVTPVALAYAGHQFGHLNPRLGDGRAVLLGELVTPDGARVDLQLKGTGRTVFSRGGDGRAAFESVVREYIVSEAMHALGIPTTRALAAIRSSARIRRYRVGPSGVLARTASSHLRVGTVEYLAIRGDTEGLRRLVDLALARHVPDVDPGPVPALTLLEQVGLRQVRLVARWMQVGFIHGVMNTDNMSLSGETLDYGPCAFMERTDPDARFSVVDEGGRYAWGRQPQIALWNLARLAEALLPAIDAEPERAVAPAQAVLERVYEAGERARVAAMGAKLGLGDVQDGDEALVADLIGHLTAAGADWTQSFRTLAEDLRHGRPPIPGTLPEAWTARWQARLGAADPVETARAMDRVNPVYIPRNHRVEAALTAAITGDLQPTRELLDVLSDPFRVQPGREAYAAPDPQGGRGTWTHCNT